MAERVIILGNTGFIGSHVEKHLSARLPPADVVGISRATVDLTADSAVALLAPYVDRQTTVIMCAAIVRHAGDTLENYVINLKLATTLSKLVRLFPPKRLILLSSAAIYGEDVHNTHITEETPVHPTSYYGMSKYTTEWLVRRELTDATSLVILRPPTIYGSGERLPAYGPHSFIDAAISRQSITLWGDGAELREFVFVDDLADIVYRMLSSGCEGVFNVVSGVSYTFLDVLDLVSRLAHFRPEVSSRPRTKHKVDHRYSNALLMQHLPGVQFTDLAEGLRRTYEMERNARAVPR